MTVKRLITDETWQKVDEEFILEGINTFHLRSDKAATVYWMRENKDEIPVCYANHEETIVCLPRDNSTRLFRIEAPKAAKVFIYYKKLPAIHQRVITEKFTTLDRPTPLSPEMQAVRRMMRQNELERERLRHDMARERQTILEHVNTNALQIPPSTTQEIRSDRQRSRSDASSASQQGEAPDVPEPASQGRTIADGQSGGQNNGSSESKRPSSYSDGDQLSSEPTGNG